MKAYANYYNRLVAEMANREYALELLIQLGKIPDKDTFFDNLHQLPLGFWEYYEHLRTGKDIRFYLDRLPK